jgi:hypothetical protein
MFGPSRQHTATAITSYLRTYGPAERALSQSRGICLSLHNTYCSLGRYICLGTRNSPAARSRSRLILSISYYCSAYTIFTQSIDWHPL